MKSHLGPRAVAAGAFLMSAVLIGCNPPIDEKKMEPPTNTNAPTPAPAPAPDVAKPAEPTPTPTSTDAAKPADSAPAPKDDSKKEETPK